MPHRWPFSLLLPLVLVATPLHADTEHNPGGGGACDRVLYTSDRTGSEISGLVSGTITFGPGGGPHTSVEIVTHNSPPGVSEKMDTATAWDWCAVDGYACWTYSGVETDTFLFTFYIQKQISDYALTTGGADYFIYPAFQDEGAIGVEDRDLSFGSKVNFIMPAHGTWDATVGLIAGDADDDVGATDGELWDVMDMEPLVAVHFLKTMDAGDSVGLVGLLASGYIGYLSTSNFEMKIEEVNCD